MATKTKPKVPKKYGRRYAWDEWFQAVRDAGEVVLRRGQHFDCAVHGMAAMIRNAASRRDFPVSVYFWPKDSTNPRSLRVTPKQEGK